MGINVSAKLISKGVAVINVSSGEKYRKILKCKRVDSQMTKDLSDLC